MSYRLGVDVGGTFTDVLLIDEASGAFHTAKVPSTPSDSSIGVLNGIEKACARAGIDPDAISHVMHGTTVATNTVLTGSGAKVGLVTTKGYAQVLQIARSFVPGGLGGWVVYQKSEPMAPLELTIEADERISAQGEIIRPLDEAALGPALLRLRDAGIEALTVCLINSFTNGEHERRVREWANVLLPGVPVSISCEVIPEMQEYERTVTTVANSYVRPKVERYVGNLQREISQRMRHARLRILRSDGGLAASEAAASTPVKLLMSGPAGGVTGALWVAASAGFPNLLTLDMGGTSTDVARVNGAAMAGGLGLVCACDFAIAGDQVRFGVPETRIGLFPMMILPYMMRVIPRRKLMEMCITGELINAEEALAIGILNYVVPAAELDAKLDWLLGRICDKSPTAIRIGKQVFHAIEDMTLDQSFELTQVMLPVMAMSEDAKEGFAAFNQKRSPNWTGK